MAVVDSKIYVIGGQHRVNAEIRALSTVEVYDSETDTWETKADMPTARALYSIGVVSGKIYVIGGSTKPVLFSPSTQTVEAYDPVADTWTQRADLPTRLTASATGVVSTWTKLNLYCSPKCFGDESVASVV